MKIITLTVNDQDEVIDVGPSMLRSPVRVREYSVKLVFKKENGTFLIEQFLTKEQAWSLAKDLIDV